MISLESIIGLPHYEITAFESEGGVVIIEALHKGEQSCPNCQGRRIRNKGVIERVVRHVSWSAKQVWLRVKGHSWECWDCGKRFRERFTGILPGQHSTEAFRGKVFQDHWDGISRSRVARREKISGSTVERHFQHFLARLMMETSPQKCPQILGIDEHFFSKKHGYATTLCDLKNHSVYDVVLGRSEASLEAYFNSLKGKDEVQMVCMDLASCYRSLVRKHFPQPLSSPIAFT